MDNSLDRWKINKNMHQQLESYTGKIVTRFPPEPSGFLHIGHAKALMINYVLAKRYGGKVILRFDDTNPVNETGQYQEGIMEDIKQLGIQFDCQTHTSDYFDQMISYAELLIKSNQAYVDSTPAEVLSQERANKVPSQYRDSPVDQNMALWNQMKDGTKTDAVLRVKMDINNANFCLRDPVIYRSIDKPHQMTGYTYKVYPTYDFACPIVDSIEGVTHVYRSTEFADRDAQFRWILKLLDLRCPALSSYGKINIKDTVLSKRKIKKLIDSGLLEGWDDPRLLTVRGVTRRGLSIDSLIDYISKLGFSKGVVNMTPTTLWAINRKIIDKIATRYTMLDKGLVREVKILDQLPYTVKDIPRFHRSPELGDRPIYYSQTVLLHESDYNVLVVGEEVTLMNWGNVIVVKDNNGFALRLNLDGDCRTTQKKLPWLPVLVNQGNIPIIIKDYGKIKVDSEGNNCDVDPRTDYHMLGEPDMGSVKKGDYVQPFKMGYYICETPYNGILNKPLVLIETPIK